MTAVYSLPISSREQGRNRPGTCSRTRKKTDDKAKAARPNPYKRRVNTSPLSASPKTRKKKTAQKLVTPSPKRKSRNPTIAKRTSPTLMELAEVCSQQEDEDNLYDSSRFLDDSIGPIPGEIEEDEFDDALMDVHLNEKGEIGDLEMNLITDMAENLFESEDLDDGLTKSSKAVYERYQNMWKAHCKKYKIAKKEETNDVHLLGFFNQMRKIYKPSTMWVIYSCINRYLRFNFDKNLNHVYKIQTLLKNYSSRYVAKKSKVFIPDQMHTILMTCMEEDNDTGLTLMGVGSTLMYFGLLRSCDVLNITVDDVTKTSDNKYEVKFEHMRKRMNPGFKYTLPAIYTPLFDRYIDELQESSTFGPDGSSRFLKNMNKRAGTRVQNTGINTVRGWVKASCTMLGIENTGYTGHVYRRSAATNLADAGVSFINLKRHGQWKSDTVVEGYIANSKPLRKEKEECLMPEHLRPESPHHKFVLGYDSKIATMMKPYLTNEKWKELFREPESSSFESNDVMTTSDEASPRLSSKKKVVFAEKANKTHVLESPNDQVINLKGLGMWKYDSASKSYAPLVQNGKPVLKKECVPSPVNVLEEVRAANKVDRSLVDVDDLWEENDSILPLSCSSDIILNEDEETVTYEKFDKDMLEEFEVIDKNEVVVENPTTNSTALSTAAAVPTFSQLILHHAVINASNTMESQGMKVTEEKAESAVTRVLNRISNSSTTRHAGSITATTKKESSSDENNNRGIARLSSGAKDHVVAELGRNECVGNPTHNSANQKKKSAFDAKVVNNLMSQFAAVDSTAAGNAPAAVFNNCTFNF